MDFKSLLQSMTALSEAEGKVHKGTYGTSHGKEDVRDQYGHKVGKVDKEASDKKDAPKKGRGRPKKGADDSGEVKTYDTKTLGSVFGGGQKPKKEVGKVSKKHSLKEYIEEAELALQEGMTSQEPIQIKPASQTQTQVIQQGDKTLGTVNNPQLAQQIKQSIGKGEMSLNPDEEMAEGKDEGKPGKNFAKIAKSAGEKYGSKAAGERVAGAVRAKLAKQGKLEESISLSESPATLQHIINRYKNEVKRFINGDELDNDLYDALYDYYADAGEMPYGTAKGRTGDPFEWITQRFDQDVHNYVVDESTARDFTQHALKEPTSSFTEPGSPMAVPKGTPTKLNRPVQDPTPWSVDPINAATDRAINFISGLGKKENKFEGKTMKDIQLESWESQLNNLLKEGITVSSSQGQQGAPDSVSITATDNDAQTLMGVLRNAGIGGFGAGEEKPEIGYGVSSQGEEEFDGTGTEPQPSPDVVGDGDDMLSMLKKMAGIGNDAEVVAVSTDDEHGHDYEDEEGEEQTLEPADSGDDDGKEELTGSEDESEEKTDEGNKFTGNLAKARAAGKSEADLDGDGDMEKVKEEEMEEGNKFTGNLAKARAAGKSEADLDGDGDMEKVREGEDTCMECGGSMYEGHSCSGEQVEENFANDAGGNAMADTELMKLKALLSMGNDLHKMKSSQAIGNPIRVAEASNTINDWKKLSGI